MHFLQPLIKNYGFAESETFFSTRYGCWSLFEISSSKLRIVNNGQNSGAGESLLSHFAPAG